MGKGWQGRGTCVRKGERDALHTVAREHVSSLAGTRSRALIWGWGRENSCVASWAAEVQAEGQNGHRVFQRVKSDIRVAGAQ